MTPYFLFTPDFINDDASANCIPFFKMQKGKSKLPEAIRARKAVQQSVSDAVIGREKSQLHLVARFFCFFQIFYLNFYSRHEEAEKEKENNVNNDESEEEEEVTDDDEQSEDAAVVAPKDTNTPIGITYL